MVSIIKRIGISIMFKINIAPCRYICDMDGSQAAAASESSFVDACHAASDGDGGKVAAIIEGMVAEAGHAVGDGDGGQVALPEGPPADAGHAVSLSIISNC